MQKKKIRQGVRSNAAFSMLFKDKRQLYVFSGSKSFFGLLKRVNVKISPVSILEAYAAKVWGKMRLTEFYSRIGDDFTYFNGQNPFLASEVG